MRRLTVELSEESWFDIRNILWNAAADSKDRQYASRMQYLADYIDDLLHKEGVAS